MSTRKRTKLFFLVASTAAILFGGAATAKAAAAPLVPTWDKGLLLQSADKDFSVRVGGRIQTDWAFFTSQSSANKLKFTDQQDGTEFRRARLHVVGTAYGVTDYRIEFDFAGGDASFRELYVGLRGLPGLTTLRIGHMQEPFSLEELSGSNNPMFLEQGLPGAFVPVYNSGLLASGALSFSNATWSAGIFRDTNNYGKNSADGKYAVTGRFTAAPVFSNTAKKVVHLGIAASVRRPNGNVVSYSRKPEINLASNFVNTGNIANANRVELFGLETLVSSGRFYAQAEGMASRIERTGGAGTAMLNGAYAFAGMFLTDDFRPYKAGNADRVIPTRNFDPRTDGWGALAVTARVSTLDLTDSGINGGSMMDGTLGLSWYLNPNTSMKANYVLAKVKDFGTASALQFRVQFDF